MLVIHDEAVLFFNFTALRKPTYGYLATCARIRNTYCVPCVKTLSRIHPVPSSLAAGIQTGPRPIRAARPRQPGVFLFSPPFPVFTPFSSRFFPASLFRKGVVVTFLHVNPAGSDSAVQHSVYRSRDLLGWR